MELKILPLALVHEKRKVGKVHLLHVENGMLRHRWATFEGEHEFLVFSTALLLLEESPLSFVVGSCSLLFP